MSLPLNFLFVTRALPYHLRTVPAAIAVGMERNDIRRASMAFAEAADD
jgi:hypothetical protein